MGWSQVKPPPAPPPGKWERWSYGKDIQGWALKCGPMFWADIRKVGEHGNYYAMLNSDPLGNDPDPKVLMVQIEREIVRRVREMLPAYRVIFARIGK